MLGNKISKKCGLLYRISTKLIYKQKYLKKYIMYYLHVIATVQMKHVHQMIVMSCHECKVVT